MKNPKVGDKIYIPSECYISHGSDDVDGGLATVKNVTKVNKYTYIEVKENPGTEYVWEYLSKKQEKLKKEFGKKKARKCPDIDTPWIEEGDTVDGKVYHGPPIW